ncbi:glyoxylase-like metal-dependent hydrolase (beta-lactamase superfamily II) [Georgenia soli]|uniref:Glyoxylase-like metal-dependent hydrolase (Beta-lactamase superfamily II) n=1 Tax=Georgenia soli TaxID=638953 RepID=A0A2A9ERS5_9MICO|nr:MBL fold metallo-hydrolase [Georgenia soli]PFG40945.1 glyoxylase-like metal-dependent hydrolase (beta-lactamase superfamily II) [Georgenia soli]
MLERDVGKGVHRLEHAYVNCYLIEDDDGRLTVVDAGLPAFWPLLGQALQELGRRPGDVAALVLTHAHFDHVGVARRLQERLGVPVWAHEKEQYLAAHPYHYAHENMRGIYPLRYPRAARILGAMTWAGALTVKGVSATRSLEDGATLDVPGRPRVILSPGHTYGHCALHLPDRDVLITGDALVTLDPYTAHTGPRIIAGAATADSAMALESLDLLAATGAGTVLPGHGEPWLEGIGSAVVAARAAGPS